MAPSTRTTSASKSGSQQSSKAVSPENSPVISEKSSPVKTISNQILNGDEKGAGPGTILKNPGITLENGMNISHDILMQAVSLVRNQKSSARNFSRSSSKATSRSRSRSPVKRVLINDPIQEYDQKINLEDDFEMESAALKFHYRNLTSTEHTCLLELFDFITSDLPSLFSQIHFKGNSIIHRAVERINLFTRTTAIWQKVHFDNREVLRTVFKINRLLADLGETINIHSTKPGLGRQLKAVLDSQNAKFLIGEDKSKMSVEILMGSAEQARSAFISSAQQLASWNPRSQENAKRSHSRKGGRGGSHFGGRSDRENESKPRYVADKKSSQRPEHSGKN